MVCGNTKGSNPSAISFSAPATSYLPLGSRCSCCCEKRRLVVMLGGEIFGYESSSGTEDECAKLFRRMNPPRVEIDNDACDNATIIMVYNVNEQGILLEVVQVLTDLDLFVTKAYISSDGGWFMDVFNVTDRKGNKIMDRSLMDTIKKSVENEACIYPSTRNLNDVVHSHTTIELTGMDRPGLLSDICAVLADLKCNVVKSELWTHNTRVAAIVCITDSCTDLPIENEERLSTIKELLRNVLKGNDFARMGKLNISKGILHIHRRLHQLMFDDRDYERIEDDRNTLQNNSSRPHVVLLDCFQKDYSVAILKSKDRPKLLFDTVCTLTDMQYVVFHGTVHTGNDEAYQEYYIRHADGLPISSEAERQRVMQCLEAAIERRAPEGLELELTTGDRVGLLSEITRVFRENGLTIRRAEISTKGGKAVDKFYVSDMSGGIVDSDTINSICQQIGHSILSVKQNPFVVPPKPSAESFGVLFSSLLRACSFPSFRLIRSHS